MTMHSSKILSVSLAIIGLIAFQADQISHAISSLEAPKMNVDSVHAHGAHLSFASVNLNPPSFENHGHPCEDLGHSEEDCPVANVVDGLDIISGPYFFERALASKHAQARKSLISNNPVSNRQIRGPPVSPV